MRRCAWLAGTCGALLLLFAAAPLAAQLRGVRFEILSVGDTTLTFRSGREGWLRRGQVGFAVDPRQRDVLVARFRLLTIKSGTATAIVTGQTTAVTTDHVAIVDEPKPPWTRTASFWVGLLIGAVLGVAGGVALH